MNHHFTEAELTGKPQPDQHWHEHATCFRLGDRGLVVISSCGHAGIIDTLKRAQQVSGIEKDLCPRRWLSSRARAGRLLASVMTELNKFDIEHVMPMHCSGQNFVDLAQKEMPEKLFFAVQAVASRLPPDAPFRRAGAEHFTSLMFGADGCPAPSQAERTAASGSELPVQEPAGGFTIAWIKERSSEPESAQTRPVPRPSHPRPRTGRFDHCGRRTCPFRGAIPLAHLKSKGGA